MARGGAKAARARRARAAARHAPEAAKAVVQEAEPVIFVGAGRPCVRLSSGTFASAVARAPVVSAAELDGSTEPGSEPGALSEDEQDRPSEFGSVQHSSKEPADVRRHEETLVIFDWDDTLLPTAWLEEQGILLEGQANAEQWAQLEALARRAAATLEQAMRQGYVIIVTNGIEGWVQGSCMQFMPSLLPMLYGIRIVSARSWLEPWGIPCPTEWKRITFDWEVGYFESWLTEGQSGNIVSVGDSIHEHHALLCATHWRPRCCAKSLRLAERPSIAQLTEEHELLAGTIAEVIQQEGDLDVDVAGNAVAAE